MLPMRLSNTCFISYRHVVDRTAQRLIEAFRDALAGQIALYIPDSTIFFDSHRLKGGDFWHPKLAAELCRSSCMVLLFNPYYFDPLHPYCAREYLGMLELEKQRLHLLGNPLDHRGLIIPVVIRGEESLPQEIRKQRHYITLDRALLQPADFRKPRILAQVHEIARLVFQRYQALHAGGVDLTGGCRSFDFPSEEHAKAWIHKVVSPPDDRLPLG